MEGKVATKELWLINVIKQW